MLKLSAYNTTATPPCGGLPASAKIQAGHRCTEGLDRHEAVHAIASVVAEHIHDLLNAKEDANSSKAVYAAAVERLNAATWRARG